jgi:ribonuclease HII
LAVRAYNCFMIKSAFELEEKLLVDGYEWVIGIDEAGRGPLAGPVVAAATTARNAKFLPPQRDPAKAVTTSNFPAAAGSRLGGDKSNPNDQISNDKNFDLIRDSKTLSEKQRESLFDFIHEHFDVGVGICDHETIDRMNILEATYLAMKKAIADLVSNIKYNVSSVDKKEKKYIIHDTKYIILIDGNKPIPNLTAEQKAIVSGDKHVKSISAASIIAKVTRDRIMMEMHEKYPQYGFDKHKGYGTKIHTDMIEKYGPCEIHRKSFNPVSRFAKKLF